MSCYVRRLQWTGWAALVLVATVATAADGSAPAAVELLGPLPLPPAVSAAGPLVPTSEPVPELDPGTVDPFAGDSVTLDPAGSRTWTRVPLREGAVPLASPGVWWVATRLEPSRFARVALSLAGPADLTLWVDGSPEPVEGSAERVARAVPLARGPHLVLARVVCHDDDPPTLRLSASAAPATLRWSLEPEVLPTSYDRLVRAIPRFGAVTVASDGDLVARALARWPASGDEAPMVTDVLAPDGTVVAREVGGAGVEPVAFLPGGHSLLLRHDHSSGDTTLSDLLLFDADDRTLRTIVADEPDLGLVHVGPGGTHLLLASARGVGQVGAPPEAPRREGALRARMPDWNPRRRLWLVEVDTGARRALTAPGDFVLDDAAFVPARQAVVYARTVPRSERPWFATELRMLDLRSGSEQLVATFTGGWENRPHSIAPDLRGRRLAFIGPPAQVGPGGPDHNVYRGVVWLLDLDDGSFTPLTPSASVAFGGAGDVLAWELGGRALLATAVDGSHERLERIAQDSSGGWQVTPVDGGYADTAAAALSPDVEVAVTLVSTTAKPPELHLLNLEDGHETVVERPAADLGARFSLIRPEDASFAGPGGERLEAWYYPPVDLAAGTKAPLVVHFYGGATPTRRSFEPFHQVLAANGYGVLVVNPRGAIGRGAAFADEHVRDWGSKAAADVLAGIDALLAAHPELDSGHIGVYGGSYGGFLTEYLLTVSPRFAAAVALYGIADLASYWGAGAWGLTYGDTALAGAFPWSDQDLFAGHSPLYRAEKITTPLLLIHGTADVNVPPDELKQLYTALKTQGKEAELVLFPGGEHGLWQPLSRRVAHLDLVVSWFDRFLRDQPEGWTARWQSP